MKSAKPQPIPFTKDGYQKIVDEYERLKNKRPDVLERLQAAREMGDLSENGAYKAARFELSDLDRNLRRLSYLKHVGIVQQQQGEEITIGTMVTLKNETREVSFLVVSKYEADPAARKLSDQSPFGQAVMGKKKGDEVKVTTPNGVEAYIIISVQNGE